MRGLIPPWKFFRLRAPAETAYILGAGVNRCVFSQDGISPPLLNDVFKVYFQDVRGVASSATPAEKEAVKFAARFVGVRPHHLAHYDSPFEDIVDSALARRNSARGGRALDRANSTFAGLVSILARTVDASQFFGPWSTTVRELGRIIVEERAPVITFNYDTILETAIETAAGADVNQKAFDNAGDPMLISPWLPRWIPRLAYGVRFDFASPSTLERAPGNRRELVSPPVGTNLIDFPFLKMHGSLNWFRYSSSRVPRWPGIPGEPPFEELSGKTVLGGPPLWSPGWPHLHGVYLEPLIVTPGRLKAEETKLSPFREIWEAATRVLSKCKRLVAIGYSFRDEHLLTYLKDRADLSGIDEVLIVGPSLQKDEEIRKVLGLPDGASARGSHLNTVDQYVLLHPLSRGF